ncbi:MAG: immunoglobulin domain-containing protein, partial [Candidatus Omnitrophica bacterium]|nr:immunoglobulin domain-containing protein [Candidatus Omnitrophota bacterium]
MKLLRLKQKIFWLGTVIVFLSLVLSPAYCQDDDEDEEEPIPNAPEEMMAYAVSNTQVVVKWADSSNNETGFVIEKSIDDGETFTTAGTVGPNMKNFTVTGLTPNTPYYFQVYATGTAGDSDPTDPVYVKTAVYIMSVQAIGGNSATASIYPFKIETNATGDRAVLGTFDGTVDFGGQSLTAATETYFVAKYNSAGTLQWARAIPTSTSIDEIRDIAISSSGYVAITGNGPDDNLFARSYNSSGTVLWTKVVNPSTDEYTWANAVAYDSANNVLITGGYEKDDSQANTFDYVIGYQFAAANGTKSNIFTKFTGTSNISAANGPTKLAEGYDIAVDGSTVVITGYMSYEYEKDTDDDYIYQYREELLIMRGDTKYTFYGEDPEDSCGYGYSLAVDASHNTFVLADIDDIPSIYKINSSGTLASGFPKSLEDDDYISSFMEGARARVDSSGNLFIIGMEDFRKYSAAGVLLWSLFDDDEATYPIPEILDGAMAGNSALVLSTGSDVTQFDQLFVEQSCSDYMVIAKYGDSEAFGDETTPPSGSIGMTGNGSPYCTNMIVTLSPSATDAGSGMGTGSRMRFSADNDAWGSAVDYNTAVSPYTLSAGDGSRKIYVQFMDIYYNWSEAIESNALIFDTAPPSGTISINGGATSTTDPAVILTLSATDAGSGMGSGAQMKFSKDNITWSAAEAYAAAKSYTLTSGYGQNTVYVKFKDVAGFWSTAYSASITLVAPDTTPPTGSIQINNGAASTADPAVTLALLAVDAGSGMGEGAQMQFSDDNIVWSVPESYATTKSYTLPSGNGPKTVYAKFKDVAGLWSLVYSANITLAVPDTTPPTGTISINGGATYATTPAVALTLSATDEGSGMGSGAQMQFSNDNITWSAAEAYAANKSWTLTSGDAPKNVYAKFKDVDGNWSSAVSAGITLDTTPPAIIITDPQDNAESSVSSITVSYTVDGIAKTKQFTLQEGLNTLTITEADLAGNSASVSITVTLTATPAVPMKETQITDSADSSSPAIYGDTVVYLKYCPEDAAPAGYDIYAHDLVSGNDLKLSTYPGDKTGPSIDENKVVWAFIVDSDGNAVTQGTAITYGRLASYDLTSTALSELNTSPVTASFWDPVIAGSVEVWTNTVSGGDSTVKSLCWADMGDVFKGLKTGEASGSNVAVYGNNVVVEEWWTLSDVPYYSINVYSLPACELRTCLVEASTLKAGSAAIYKNKIAWVEGAAIYVYDLDNDQKTQITTALARPCSLYPLAIYEDKIVWLDEREKLADATKNYSIHIYDLPTGQEKKVVDVVNPRTKLAIYENRIVWSDDRDEAGMPNKHPDVYMAEVFLAPQITTCETESLAQGSAINISGKNFGCTQGESKVEFTDGAVLPVNSWSNNAIICEMPAGTHPNKLRVITPGGQSDDATIAVIVTPPTITQSPANLTKGEGDQAVFSIQAIGTAPLSYQWQKNANNITGATSATYTIASVVGGDAGNYKCIVTNAAGSAVSNEATLTVNSAPAITAQPSNLTLNPGQQATFTVAASGTNPLTYQWQ